MNSHKIGNVIDIILSKIGKQAITYDKLIWIVTVIFLSLVSILDNSSFGSIVLFGCGCLIALLAAIKNGGKIKFRIELYHWGWLFFGVYSLVSSLWAWNSSLAISKGITTIELILCMSLIYVYYQKETDLWQMYNAVKWSGFIVCLYTVIVVGVDIIMSVLVTGNRLMVDFANINSIGILSAFAVVITVYEAIFKEKNIISWLLSIPCVIMVAASGTRKALLIVIMGIALLLIFKYQNKNFLKTCFKFLTIGLIACFIAFLVLSLPMFSGIMNRMESLWNLFIGEGEVDGSALLRNRMIQIGFGQFLKTPIFGIGIGNSSELLGVTLGESTYLHNNYIELLCCGGIVGFVIYYWMFYYCTKNLFKYKNSKDNTVILGIVLIVVLLTMDVARVSYYSKNTFFYTMIFFLHVKQLKREALQNENS